MALQRITAPSVEPLTLEETKAHLRVTHTDDDALIAIYIAAATSHVDGQYGFLGRALVRQTWELVLDAFPAVTNNDGVIRIPLPPLLEVVSIKYDDSAGNEQTLGSTQYYADTVSQPGWVVPITAGWPTTIDAINAVRIRFTCGYPPSNDSPDDLRFNIPRAIRHGLLLHVGWMYEHREELVAGVSVVRLPWNAENLLRPFRVELPLA